MSEELPDYRFVTTGSLRDGVIADRVRCEAESDITKRTFPNVIRWPGAESEIERRTRGLANEKQADFQ